MLHSVTFKVFSRAVANHGHQSLVILPLQTSESISLFQGPFCVQFCLIRAYFFFGYFSTLNSHMLYIVHFHSYIQLLGLIRRSVC
jgi:hypothetical protein